LFGLLEEETGHLLPSHQEVAMVLEVIRIEEHVRDVWLGQGRPPMPRKPLARAFVAKSVLNIPTTKDLIDRLRADVRLRRVVGFPGSVPSESTFCRAFAELSKGVTDATLEAKVRQHLGEDVIHHVSHDSTAILGRERGPKKAKIPKGAPSPKSKRGGRRVKGQGEPSGPTVQQLQEGRSWRESLQEVPMACDYGVKLNSQGFQQYWRGYKGHASVGDAGIPLAFFTSSASMADCNGAIPLMQMVAGRVGQVFYNLFDAGYQGEPIRRTGQALDQVVIVPPKHMKKSEPAPQLPPDRARRLTCRTVVERFMSDLKENHGGNFIFVRGGHKVHAHLMYGVLSIFALRILRV
jgi:hypothetical protein